MTVTRSTFGLASQTRFGLRFTAPDAEQAYRAWRNEQSLPLLRLAWGVGIPATLSSSLPGYLWWPGINWFGVFLSSYVLVLPLQVLMIVVTYSRFRRLATVLGAFVLAVSGSNLLWCMAVGTQRALGLDSTGPAMVATILSAVFALFMRLPPLLAVTSIAPFMIPAMVLAAHRAQTHSIPAIQAYPYVFFAGLACFFIAAMSIVGERFLRRAYVNEEMLARQKIDADRVIAAAGEVEAGIYRVGELADLAGHDDELGRLARIFDEMVVEIHVRETQLREQVRALQVEVVAARRGGLAGGGEQADDSMHTGDFLAGRYQITGLIGRGGMGAVFRAVDRELGEDVAVKTLRPEFTADAALLERFRSEIRLARKITHRNVVRTHDIGESGGVYYLTMELVQGITVRELVDTRGRLSVDATLAIASQLAEALAVAHAEGIIHRDIKSQNLLLDETGLLKVMDFGVARLAERSQANTEPGLLVGTPAYMAPEQLMGEAIDARSDLYSAGMVLYECLAGRLPYEAATPMLLLAKRLSNAPEPLESVNPAVPAPVAALVMRLLAWAPEQRFASASDLGREVARLAS